MASDTKHGRPGSMQVAPLVLKPPVPVQQSGPSSISMFLTNLRLLDLDLRKDWPGISLQTFSTTDPQQNQKRRIQCAEWALYNLYSFWNEEETETKLSAFFPPLDHLQSLHLRAALHRSLDRAKKDGALGRHVVLRRTMFDECKGEQFEDFLSAFSSIVLKDRARCGQFGHDTIAQRLALEKFSYKSERTTLRSMVLAYKSSLTNILAEKNRLRSSYASFSATLLSKEDEFQVRQKQLTASIGEREGQFDLTTKQVSSVQDESRAFWTGSNAWFNTLISGDIHARKIGFLSTSYECAWARVEHSQIDDGRGQSKAGLLEQLEFRVTEQRQRLARWLEYEKTLKPRRETAKDKMPMPSTKLNDQACRFRHVFPEPSDLPKTKSTDVQPVDEEYTDFVAQLEEQLANVSRPHAYRKATSEASQTQVSGSNEEVEDRKTMTKNYVVQEGLDHSNDTADTMIHSAADDVAESLEALAIQARDMPEDVMQGSMQADLLPCSVLRDDFMDVMPMSTSAERVAHTPLAFPTAVSLSPVIPPAFPSAKQRHVLTLAERTRLSMSRKFELYRNSNTDTMDANDSESSLLSSSGDQLSSCIMSPPQPEILVKDATILPEPESKGNSLAARTRTSMSNNAAIARGVQLERRQSLKAAARTKRASYMPTAISSARDIDECDTGDTSGSVDDMKRPELMDDAEANYESVFMSRPKVKCSPPLSPVKTWNEVESIVEEAEDSETI